MLHLVHVIQEGSLQCWFVEADLPFNPVQVLVGPVLLDRLWRHPAVPEEELAQALPSALLILFVILAGSDQIAHRFMGWIGNPHWGQVPRAIAPLPKMQRISISVRKQGKVWSLS